MYKKILEKWVSKNHISTKGEKLQLNSNTSINCNNRLIFRILQAFQINKSLMNNFIFNVEDFFLGNLINLFFHFNVN